MHGEGGSAAGDAPRVAVVENDPRCPLDRFEGWLGAARTRVFRPYADGVLPRAGEWDALIALGGRNGTDDAAVLDWLRAERDALREHHERGVPVLGVCLGAQLLAEALGGEVEHAAINPGEYGAIELTRTEAGEDDALLGTGALGAAPLLSTASHRDRVATLPPGARLLMSSAVCEVQAFRLGDSVGLQFHPEVSPERFASWMATKEALAPDARALIVDDQRRHLPAIERTGRAIATRFAALLP